MRAEVRTAALALAIAAAAVIASVYQALVVAALLTSGLWLCILFLLLLDWQWLRGRPLRHQRVLAIFSTATISSVIVGGLYSVEANREAHATLSLECKPDLRTGPRSSLYGDLPTVLLFLLPDGHSTQITVTNESDRDANGYLYEIRTFFIRCNLQNVTSVDVARAMVTFRGWFVIEPSTVAPGEILYALDPGLKVRQQAPDITAVLEAPTLEHTPLEFAIVNRSPRPVYLSNLPTASIVRPDASSSDAAISQSKMSQWAFLNVFPPAELKYEKAIHFSKCHYATYETPVERQRIPQYVPPECQPDALERERQQWKADDKRNHIIDD